MPTKRPQLVSGEIYHVVTRGVGDSLIFKNIDDYYRGIFSLYEFNNKNLIEIRRRREDRKREKARGGLTPAESVDKRDLFTKILAFCFMPNHIHLLLQQTKDNGISDYMKKVGTGYASYFNKKYNRKGHLFSRFKAIHVADDKQLKNVFAYIHTNPISLIEPGWKEKGIKSTDDAAKFLGNYKWSSYQDYIGRNNFSSVTDRDFLSETIGGPKGCEENINNWIEYKKDLKEASSIVLE